MLNPRPHGPRSYRGGQSRPTRSARAVSRASFEAAHGEATPRPRGPSLEGTPPLHGRHFLAVRQLREGTRCGAVRSKFTDVKAHYGPCDLEYPSFSPTDPGWACPVVFVASEVAPWSKTGGLGDVMGALPPAIAAQGRRVMVVSPMYQWKDEFNQTGVQIDIQGHTVTLFHCYKDGVDWIFVEHMSFLREGGLYGPQGGDYDDNQFRYMLLSLAALEIPLCLPLGGSVYGEEVVFVANDWQAALVPTYLAAVYQRAGAYRTARSALIVHNLAYQGVYGARSFGELGLPLHWFPTTEYRYEDGLGPPEEQGRTVNTLKAGLITADAVVTVSPNYCVEIQTSAEGCGMQEILASRGREGSLRGILNGIDTGVWNPETDPHLPANYGPSTFTRGKAACKAALQERLGLAVSADAPLVAFIGRLATQKGADVLLEVAPWLMEQGAQLICLGTGDPALEAKMRELHAEWSPRGSAACIVGFDVPLSHVITAAADMLVMPSRFEPCGLNQLYALRYGTIPIATATGGLKDTVIDYDPWSDSGTGWTAASADPGPLRGALGAALHTYYDHPDAFWAMRYRAVRMDFSWDAAAAEYAEVFASIRHKLPATHGLDRTLDDEGSEVVDFLMSLEEVPLGMP